MPPAPGNAPDLTDTGEHSVNMKPDDALYL